MTSGNEQTALTLVIVGIDVVQTSDSDNPTIVPRNLGCMQWVDHWSLCPLHLQASYDYNFIKINYCCSNHPQLWNSCLLTYTLSVAGLATMFGCLNSHIPARYREESAASYKVVAMLVILILIDAIITTYLFMTRRLFATLLWISTLSTCGFAVAALTTLFVPKVRVCTELEGTTRT